MISEDLKVFVYVLLSFTGLDVFLAVLAFGLRSLLELKLRRNNLQITAEEALQQLGKIRVLCVKGRILRTT